jgi:nuclear GTP-binding protein
VINTLISKKSCKVAPVPGETKIWQYITLFKRIALIDCPGVVVDSAGDSEVDSVLKGVVRAEKLENPQDFVDPILANVKPEHIMAQYKLTEKWTDAVSLMEMIAKKCGRLRKGGDPCQRSAAVMLVNDYQRGRLPHYVAPPELKSPEDQDDMIESKISDTKELLLRVHQNLDEAGEEHMKKETEEEDTPTDPSPKGSREPATKPSAAELIGDGDWEDEE